MTLRFIEGFDHWTSNVYDELQLKWGTLSTQTNVSSSTITPHNHGRSILLDADEGNLPMFTNPLIGINSLRSGIVGFHFRTSDFSQDDTEPIIAWLRNDGAYQITLRANTGGNLRFFRGNTVFLLAGSAVLSNNTWYYLEVKYYIADQILANSFQLRVDGVLDINLATNTDTAAASTTNTELLRWEGADGTNRYIDNIYLITLDGTRNRDFLGKCFVETLYPTGDSLVNFVGSDGDSTNNYLHVDETNPDNDTTFVQTSGANVDRYKFPAPSGAVNTIVGIQLTCKARKTTTSHGEWNNIAHISGIEYVQATHSLHTSYDYFFDIFEVNPNTNGTWLTTDIPQNSFGVKYIP